MQLGLTKVKGHSSFIMQYLILFWFYSFWFWIKIIKETRKLEKSVGQKQGIHNILTQLIFRWTDFPYIDDVSQDQVEENIQIEVQEG